MISYKDFTFSYSLETFDERAKRETILATLWFSLSTMYRITNVPVATAINLSTKLDSYIPVIPLSILIYHSWYPILFLLLKELSNTSDAEKYMKAIVIANFLCVLTYIFLPSYVPLRQDIVMTGLSTKLLKLTYDIDNPYNGFPSSHVALASVCAFFAYKNKKNFYAIWMFLIILSTTTTRQHVIFDVVGGILYASFVLYVILPKISFPDYHASLAVSYKNQEIYLKHNRKNFL